MSESARASGLAADSPNHTPVVLVPVKRFDLAKLRLAEQLKPEQRYALAQAMAENVIRSAAPLPTFVVCDDVATAQWATDLSQELAETTAAELGTIQVSSAGLNPALTEAVEKLPEAFSHVLIAHGDLPQATSLAGAANHPEAVTNVLIVPDRHLQGTNVMSLPRLAEFKFQYGVGSLQAHIAEALRLGLGVTLLRVPELENDVDNPEDLVLAQHLLSQHTLP